MKNYIINSLNEANIADEDIRLDIMTKCREAIDNVLSKEIERNKFINAGENIHEELWCRTGDDFSIEFDCESLDVHFEAKIKYDEEISKYIGKIKITCLGIDRDNIINELYNGPNTREYVHLDYKKIMAMMYYDYIKEFEWYMG